MYSMAWGLLLIMKVEWWSARPRFAISNADHRVDRSSGLRARMSILFEDAIRVVNSCPLPVRSSDG